MYRVKVAALAALVVVGIAGVLSPEAGLASPPARSIPAGLEAAIHARFGAGPIQLADSPTEHPQLGSAVAMSADGTTALVTATGAGNLKGAAYVYHVADAGSWVSSSTPTATLAGTGHNGLGELLGWSGALSADGTTAFVSAPFRFGTTELGAVLVFHVSDESAWASTSTPTAVLTVDNAYMFGLGGLAVSSDGTTLVVGDPAANTYAGGAEVFHVASEDAWASTSTPSAVLTNAAQSMSDFSAGQAVAISGDGTTALVSDSFRSRGTGGTYVFHVASEGAWATSSAPTAILSNASGVAHDVLGITMALSGDGTTAFLGAPGANGRHGAVDVFHAADAGSWATSSTPTAILTNGAGSAYDDLGEAVTVSADGATVVATAPGVLKKGATYVFHASGEDVWASTATPAAALTNSASARGDFRDLGVATSADGETVLLGSPLVNWRTGTADVFHVADAGSWLTSSTPTATLTNSALPKPLCVVPSLTKYHLHIAKEILNDANCRLGKVTRVHSTPKNRRLIVAQTPAPRRHLPPGSKVNVKVGK